MTLPQSLLDERGMFDVGAAIWRPGSSETAYYTRGKETVGEFLSRHQSGEWLIDGGWGGPPGPLRVKWDGNDWINLGFPPWDLSK